MALRPHDASLGTGIDDRPLEGCRALITGAGGGIGRAGAMLFAKAGARVAAMDVDADGVAETVAAIRSQAGEAIAIVSDLEQPGTSEAIVEQAAAAMGGLDILWCNAGIMGPPEIEQIPAAAYEAAVAINMTSPILSCSAALPHLRRSWAPAIVVTSSTSGLVGAMSSAVYSATKFAVVGFVKSLALRVAAYSIRVNAVCPGPVLTPLMSRLIEEGTGSMTGAEYESRILSSVPIGRLADPEEIAQAALWLASPRASFVTGVAFPVDGGFTAR